MSELLTDLNNNKSMSTIINEPKNKTVLVEVKVLNKGGNETNILG